MLKTIGCSRFVYNHYLHRWNTTYAQTGKGLSYETCSALLPQMKREEATCWLKEVNSTPLQSSLKNPADSFSRFFKKQNHRPTFKSKKNPVQSHTTKNVNNSIELKEKHVKLPKLGLVTLAKSQKPKGRILNATIRRHVSGTFFVSLLCEEDIHELSKTGSAVGIDLGITDFAILSDDRKVDNNRYENFVDACWLMKDDLLARKMELEVSEIPIRFVKNQERGHVLC